MAKPTAPLLSFGASGTLAKTMVYSRWKGRPYVRRHVIPANPKSTAQTSTRDAFSSANSIWKIAGPLLIAPWDRFATGQVLTGRNKFMGNYVLENRGLANLQSWNMSPGAKGGTPLVSAVSAVALLVVTLTVVTPTPPAGWSVQSVVGAMIEDQDPETGILFETFEGDDAAAPFDTIVLTGANTGLHVWGAWIRWTKPDGSIAYSVATMGTETLV